MARPDAVTISKTRESGGDDDSKKESVVEIAEPLLECGPHELAWCRDQASYYFCTRDSEDSELYPTWHPESGKPRYDWQAGADGIKLGYLRCGS